MRCSAIALGIHVASRYSSHFSAFASKLQATGATVTQHTIGILDRGLVCSGNARASLAQLSAPISRECWDLITECSATPYSLVVIDACNQRLSRLRSECAVERANALVNACAIGLQCTAEGGCLVIRLSDALSRLTAGVLMLLTSLFRDMSVLRPPCCKHSSAESFVSVPAICHTLFSSRSFAYRSADAPSDAVSACSTANAAH
jgi:hypothetical protein